MSYNTQPEGTKPDSAVHAASGLSPHDAVTVARLSTEHVAAMAKLHAAAFPTFMSTNLGGGYLRAVMDWFGRTDSAIGLVAMDSADRVVGYAIGAPVGYNKSMSRSLRLTAAVGLLLHPGMFLDRRCFRLLRSPLRFLSGRPIPRGDEPVLPGPTMMLVGIVVDPTVQGRGIGASLLSEFERRARARGMRSLKLTVYPDNPAALRLYEKCGWQFCTPRDMRFEMLIYAKTLADSQ